MYQIEVHTTSESQETRIVRFNPKAVQKALENSFEDKIKVTYKTDGHQSFSQMRLDFYEWLT